MAHYSLFIIKKGHYSLIIIPHQDPLVRPISDPHDGFFYPTFTLMIDYYIIHGYYHIWPKIAHPLYYLTKATKCSVVKAKSLNPHQAAPAPVCAARYVLMMPDQNYVFDCYN